jgi:hypothetical protein
MPSFQTFVVEQGDVLYIPRGFVHEAITGDYSSAHLTVGIYAYRFLDLISEMIVLLAEERIELRQTLPPGFLAAPPVEAAAKLVQEVASAMRDGALVERATTKMGKRLLDNAKVIGRGHLRSLDGIRDLAVGSVVERMLGLRCSVRTAGEEAVIEFAGNFVAGPLLVLPAFEFVATKWRFAVSELPGELSDEDKVDLVRRLVSEGLLEMDE